jgi:SIR2-like domain
MIGRQRKKRVPINGASRSNPLGKQAKKRRKRYNAPFNTMNGQKEAVATLAPLLRATAEPCPLLLLGAGASFRSGVPPAAEAVKQIARLVYAEQVLGGIRPPERVKPSEWEPWLQSFPWFIHGADRLAENFPRAVEHLLVPAEFRKQIILELMQPRNGLSVGYKILADFVMRGLLRTILTTNFDTCIPDALRERQPHIRHIHEVNREPGDYDQFNVFNKCQVVWLHGRAEQYSDKNASGEVSAVDFQLVALLRPLLDSSPIIVIGYRGSEASVMDGLFAQTRQGRLDFAHGIYWCIRHGEASHPNVEALSRRIGPNFRFLEVDGFDELFQDLSIELAGQDRYSGQSSESLARESQAFDERIVQGATPSDLDVDLALSVMREYCEKLGRAAVTQETLLPLMREQGLIVSDGGNDSITAGALLLFGNRTQNFFRHAVISVTEAGKKREVFDGNLITQHRALLQKLETLEVNPLLKVKKRHQHDEQTAYPPRALVELLVNMLVHRDYEIPEPATIEVRPGNEIVFTNPGGLTQKLAGKVILEKDGRFTLRETLTDQRNPSLCDVFFGISAMERAGTGLMDVGQLVLESGGACAFYHHEREARFEARIVQPQASAGSRSVARLTVPTGLYILNALPFTVMPEKVSIVRLLRPLRDRPSTVDLSECGIFIHRGDELWSFVPLPILAAVLDPIVDKQASRSVPTKQIEASLDDKRILSWLLRKHWEWHLVSFEDHGIVLEESRKYRAYFAGKNKGPRTIVWNSSQRRGIRREVVKRRADGPRRWFENEGIGYEIVEIDSIWCVRIKPFYMFTGHDALTPLPVFTRSARATRRMKFDRNKSVEADLIFWANLLSRGTQTINVGGQHVRDLVIQASFLAVEVPEIGLLSDEPEHQNPMSA